MLARIFGSRTTQRASAALYGEIVAKARSVHFYRDWGVADSVDGRFDMIALMAGLVLRRLAQLSATGADLGRGDLAQSVFDLMFDDMSHNLTEMGVGDTGIPRKVQAMAQAFYGRAKAYDSALIQKGNAELIDAIIRNIYRGLKPSDDVLYQFCAEIRALDQALAGHGAAEFKAGRSGLLARGES
jgi:cytochrome b pre-mRNA-processing protein 3